MLKQRVITAIILLLLLLAALFQLPTPGWFVLIIVIVMLGISEWTRLAHFSGKRGYAYWCASLALMGSLLWLDAGSLFTLHARQHLPVYAISALLWLLLVPLWLARGWQVRQPLAMALIGWSVIIPTGLAMMDLRELSPWLLLGMMAMVWMADIAAYFAGRRFGKHKLAPRISPGKTWEGVMGGMLGVSLYVLMVWNFSAYVHQFISLPVLLLASWFWAALAVVGDLFESAIKRQAGVKDSGSLLPGHGGLLDRIDALTSTLPLAIFALLLQGVL